MITQIAFNPLQLPEEIFGETPEGETVELFRARKEI